MRAILFRSKRIDNGEWVVDEGIIFLGETVKLYGHFNFYKEIEVDKNTLGQYTGLTDRNGTKIFEGDIVQDIGNKKYIIVYDTKTAQFMQKTIGCQNEMFSFGAFCMGASTKEVIGNIYDNPELY